MSAALSLCLLSGCQKGRHLHMEDAPTPQSVYVWTQPGSPVEASAGVKNVTIYATSAWTAESQASWITLSAESGEKGAQEVSLTYQANTTGAQRTGVVAFTSGSYTETFTLTQK